MLLLLYSYAVHTIYATLPCYTHNALLMSICILLCYTNNAFLMVNTSHGQHFSWSTLGLAQFAETRNSRVIVYPVEGDSQATVQGMGLECF